MARARAGQYRNNTCVTHEDEPALRRLSTHPLYRHGYLLSPPPPRAYSGQRDVQLGLNQPQYPALAVTWVKYLKDRLDSKYSRHPEQEGDRAQRAPRVACVLIGAALSPTRN